MGEHFDLLIRGGTLIDGTGAPRREADLAIRDGRIAALGTNLGDADRVLEVDGCVVAPGFVDIHTHYDAQIFWDRMLTISPWHGVTSVVMGNCGFGIAPTRPADRDLILRTLENVEGMSLEALHAGVGEVWPFETFPEYLDAIQAHGAAINLGALVGHTPVRMYVMGEESTEREATPDEIDQMERIVTEALAAGAIGFATSKSPTHVGYAGRPVPSRVASHEEIERLAGCLGAAGHGVMQATVGRGLFLNEFAEIQKRIGRPISWTALLTGMGGGDFHRHALETSEKLHAQGIEVIPQVSCRPLNFEFQWKAPFPFESMSLFKPVSEADFEGKKRIYADPEFRRAFAERREGGGIAAGWERTVISSCPTEPALDERNVMEVAEERGVDPVDLVLDLGLASNLEARFRMAVMNTDEDAVGELLQHPGIMLGLSDAGAHASQLCDACFSTDLLSRWVREKEVLSLEQAVRLLTSRSADVFGITDRGRLAEGLAGDVAVFDPETVGCSPLRRVRDLPGGADRLVADAEGMRAVVVNGVIIREDGVDRVDPDGALPGRVLRGGQMS
ncbi:MAG: amidohydrolase family protein [Proteobacteria bacterium]|nr:amidohydrolase family protein [Pseudomonadota bacterium]MCZ6783735.1 amidohydrolase family protein [Pseudomonadota bacterium]